MKPWIGAALAGALALGGCQTTADFAAGGVGTRTTVKPPDTTRWASRKADERTIVYICRPLACPERAGVRVRTGRSPTRTPDPAALEKLARETLPSRVEAASLTLETDSKGYTKLDVLGTKTTTIRDFPAVTVDVRKTGEGRPMFGRRVYLFAGNTLIDVYAMSHSRELAHRYADEFIAGFDIDDRPPGS
ncbi:MAG: hypothetical protein ACJ8BE_18275 [Microvirga sp.]